MLALSQVELFFLEAMLVHKSDRVPFVDVQEKNSDVVADSNQSPCRFFPNHWQVAVIPVEILLVGFEVT